MIATNRHEAESITRTASGPVLGVMDEGLSSLENFVGNLVLQPSDEQTPLLWDDQRRRWQNGERPIAEMYLRCLPAPVSDEVVLDLIYGEFMLRREAGENPTIEEYQHRFPEHAAQIVRQFTLQGALSAGARSTLNSRGKEIVTKKEALPYPAEIAGYKIVAALASGGQGDIYRAVHPTLGRDVVIKLGRAPVKVALETDDLVREGRILAELDDPGLARVYDLRIHEGRPCLVMEFLRGRDLEQDAHDSPRDPNHAATLVARIARALAAAHPHSVIHRDIKPRNIIIDEAGNPRLIDFGLALVEDAWHHASDVIGLSGTVSYMAPEQARGERPDARSDVFGLGSVLYFLLTGHAPFRGGVFNEVLNKAQRNDWGRASLADPRIPAGLRVIVERALATDPAERYRSAAELAADLDEFSRPHHRMGLLALGAGFLTILLAVGLWYFFTADHSKLPIGPAPQVGVPTVRPFAMQVRVWRSNRYVDLVDSLPLTTRDEIRFETLAPAALYASLFIHSGSGKVELLASAAPGKVDANLAYPADLHSSARLTGPAGNELILLGARSSGPISADKVRELLAGCSAWPTLPEDSLLALDSRGVRVIQASRDIGPIIDRPDPEGEVRRGLEELQRRLRPHFEHLEILVFAHGD